MSPSSARIKLEKECTNNLSSHSHRSHLLSKSSKGDALAIAEAYRRKRRREAISVHKDEVQKAKKFTEIINEHGSKNRTQELHLAVSHKNQRLWNSINFAILDLQDVEDDRNREKALDLRINEIKEQNRAIIKRNREIEQDREMYG